MEKVTQLFGKYVKFANKENRKALMYKLVITVIIYTCLSLGSVNAAVSWTNKQQKDNAKKANVWSRFNDVELCEKLSLSAKGSSMRRMLNAERIKRHLKCPD